jgi:hypothetical protein
MAILEKVPGLIEALCGEMTPKFLATRSPDGIPNVVPCVSILPAEDQPDTLFFGNFLLRKSIKNLEADSRLGVLVITPELKGWILKGDFVEFQRTGPYVNRQMSGNLLRYNAYTGIRNAGVIRVRSFEGGFRISKLQVALEYLGSRLASYRLRSLQSSDRQVVKLPLPVRREFARMAAVKVLAWIGEEGYPCVVPALSLQPAGETSLIGRLKRGGLPVPPSGSKAACNILTFEAVSYQAKGDWTTLGDAGALQVQEVYAGGPPYPGGRVA